MIAWRPHSISTAYCKPVLSSTGRQGTLPSRVPCVRHHMSSEDGPAGPILEKMRISLKRRGAEGIRGLGRHFKIVDRNKNGYLDPEEFEQCCKINGLGLTPP